MADSRSRYKSYRNAKRRAEAISFLSNISLSGRTEGGQAGKGFQRPSSDRKQNGDVSDSTEAKEDDSSAMDLISPTPGLTICADINSVSESKGNRLAKLTPSPRRPSQTVTVSGKHRTSLTILHHTEASITPDSMPAGVHIPAKIRKSYSTSRTRRTSGGVTPPSSPTKGGDRFFMNRSFSSDQRFSRQVPSDPTLHRSAHSSSEELQQVIPVRKLSSLESPPEGIQLDFARARAIHSYSNGSQIVLVSNHKVPIAIWSHLRYNRTSQYGFGRRDSEALARTRVNSVASRPRTVPDEFPRSPSFLDSILLGGEGKTVSYSHMLVPTMSLSSQVLRRLAIPESVLGTSPVAGLTERDSETVMSSAGQYSVYDPNRLDDPELISGKHKKLFTFSSYRVSVIDYAKPSALKRDINEKFRAQFPRIELTLSKLRSIKREMKKIIIDECELDPGVLAHAYVYFEKLVLYEKINKENRKLLAGVCLILSAKMNDIKGAELEILVKEIEDTFRENQKDLFAFEFPVLVALEFALHIPMHEVMPHYIRLMQT